MSNNEKFSGTVIWFDPKKGIGFIAWDREGVKQKDMFLHFSDIECEGFKTVNKEQKVSFEIGMNKHGDPKAVCVELVK